MLETINTLKIASLVLMMIGIILFAAFIVIGITKKPCEYKFLLSQRDKGYKKRAAKEERIEKTRQSVRNKSVAGPSSAELKKRVEEIKKTIKTQENTVKSGAEETSLLNSGADETKMLETGKEETTLLNVEEPTGELNEETTALAATDEDETGFLGTNNVADSFKTKENGEKQETLKKTRQFVVDDEEFYNTNQKEG
jgi:hypothetical protein